MSTDLATITFTPEKVDLLKNTIAKGATNDELALFLHICQRTGLDPFARQIHAVKRRQMVDGQWREVMSYQIGIDGFRLTAERTGRYCPGREPSFAYATDGALFSATAYVLKYAGNAWHEVAATAIYDEYVQTSRDGKPNSMWAKMPHSQLAKCAEALALRRAFPAELSGLYTNDEMGQADNGSTPAVTVIGNEQAPSAQPAQLPPPAEQAVEVEVVEPEPAPALTSKMRAAMITRIRTHMRRAQDFGFEDKRALTIDLDALSDAALTEAGKEWKARADKLAAEDAQKIAA